jgi:ABC-type sugar transport system, periplasmic component
MKKVLSLVLALALLVSVLAGCGGDTGKESSASTPESTGDASTPASEAGGEDASVADTGTDSGEKIKITVTRWGEIEANDAEKTMVDKFNAENDKNIEIVYDVVPGDGYGDRLTTSFSSGEGYDIFASGEGDFYKWVDTGLAASIDDLMTSDGEWTKEINSSILEMGKIQDKQYYIVRDYNPICLWYNKDLFDEHGVDYPTNDWTWDDLLAAAKTLTVKDGDDFKSFGFNAQGWEYALLTYLQSNGLEIMNPEGTTAEGFLNSPEMIAALEEYATFSEGDDRISPSGADFDAFGDASAMLINGTLAMTLNGGWAKSSMEDSGVNYGTAVVPGNHESYLCASAYAISTRCKNPEAAWEVIKALTGTECTSLRTQYTAALPTIDSQLEELKGTLGEQNMGLIDQLEFSVQPAGLRSALGNPAVSAFKEAYERIVFKDGDAKTIMDEAVEQAENP